LNYLLDTNVISEIRKGARCNEIVAAWWSTIEEDEIFFSVLTIGEIRRGVENIADAIRGQPRSWNDGCCG